MEIFFCLLIPSSVISTKNIWFDIPVYNVKTGEKADSLQKRVSIPKPNPKWGKTEETEVFAQKVKLFRQGKLSEDDFRRFRLQHGTYGSRLQMNYSMVRIKIPSGEINPEQLEKIASLSEAFSIGSAHVSTRQNVQLHWVQLEDVSEVMRGLVEVGLTTREACGNTIRNSALFLFRNLFPFLSRHLMRYHSSYSSLNIMTIYALRDLGEFCFALFKV
jgi:sulfite reductase (ferredoxin)